MAESRKSLAEAVYKAALMREAALKSVIFVGVPRVSGINLKEAFNTLGFEVSRTDVIFRRFCL